jgi:hypothetical protein
MEKNKSKVFVRGVLMITRRKRNFSKINTNKQRREETKEE